MSWLRRLRRDCAKRVASAEALAEELEHAGADQVDVCDEKLGLKKVIAWVGDEGMVYLVGPSGKVVYSGIVSEKGSEANDPF